MNCLQICRLGRAQQGQLCSAPIVSSSMSGLRWFINILQDSAGQRLGAQLGCQLGPAFLSTWTSPAGYLGFFTAQKLSNKKECSKRPGRKLQHATFATSIKQVTNTTEFVFGRSSKEFEHIFNMSSSAESTVTTSLKAIPQTFIHPFILGGQSRQKNKYKQQTSK